MMDVAHKKAVGKEEDWASSVQNTIARLDPVKHSSSLLGSPDVEQLPVF